MKKFNTRADMLDVLHLTYQYFTGGGSILYNQDLINKLSVKKQKQLGKKLAQYWDIKR